MAREGDRILEAQGGDLLLDGFSVGAIAEQHEAGVGEFVTQQCKGTEACGVVLDGMEPCGVEDHRGVLGEIEALAGVGAGGGLGRVGGAARGEGGCLRGDAVGQDADAVGGQAFAFDEGFADEGGDGGDGVLGLKQDTVGEASFE